MARTKSKKARINELMTDPEVQEIATLATGQKGLDFVFELTEYFDKTEIILILRAARTTGLI